MTKDDVKNEFLAKLQSLFDEYGAEIEAKDHYMGYPECGEDIRMIIDIPGIYEDGEEIRPWTEIDIGTYFEARKK
jgi:hypothetical protein